MSRVFAIGDIHGCSKTFKKMLLEVIKITKADKIYCIGDYVDRGKDSKGVIDFILQLRSNGYKIHTLRGNHEQMMLNALINIPNRNHWLKSGGKATLESFGIESVKELTDKYVTFLKRTKYFIITSNYIFVHAGLNLKIDNPYLDKEAMLWSRDIYFDSSKLAGRLLIHGHSPIPLNSVVSQTNQDRINIDGGCVFNAYAGFGNLIALSLPDLKFIHVRNIDN